MAAKLHLVFGGELTSTTSTEFADPSAIDVVGIYPSHDAALKAWRGKAQQTVDNALVRYFVADLTRLRELEADGTMKAEA